MNTLTGRYFDGRHPIGSAATLIWQDAQASLIGEHVSTQYQTAMLSISPRIGQAERFIAFPDGGQLQCMDEPALDTLPQQSVSEGPVAWLERRWPVAVVGIVLTLAILGAGYHYGLPRLAEFAAARIPIEVEQDLGNTTLGWLEDNAWLGPSELKAETRRDLNARFAQLVRGLPLQHAYRLEFRYGPPRRIAANALALPGGTIVVTDALVQASQSPEEVIAVLAHEIGHVELRHTMRHVIQNSGVAAGIAALTSDAASMGTIVAGLPAVLAQASYSREFEAAADDYAFALLKRHHISPARFADMMERLEQRREGEDASGTSFLASHPATPERIRRAREAAGSTGPAK